MENSKVMGDHKRNRQLERESNLLKDELCTMKHLIHLLDNIKRVSRDCINHLHLMVDAAMADDKPSMDQLKDDVEELEDELREWERKYHVMNNIEMRSQNEKIRLSGEPCKGVLAIRAGNSAETGSINGNFDNLDKTSTSDGQTQDQRSNPSIIPQELCEISMETYDGDHLLANSNHCSDANHPPSNSNFNCTNSPPPISLSSSSSNSPAYNCKDLVPANNRTYTGQFQCDVSGCSFKTNIKQRMVMHKRFHAGENLFSCDFPGCDYQSNYKGNIKIHKKHRHKIGADNESSTSMNTSQLDDSVLSKLQEVVPGQALEGNAQDLLESSSGMFPRKRRRRSRFRLTMNRNNVPIDSSSSIFVCEVKGCKYRTKWKQCLTAHQLLHAGVKPYKCDYPGCNYSTNFKGNVNVHKRVHRTSTNNEIYKCTAPGCDFTTPWKNSFNLHQRNHFEQNNADSNDASDYSNLDLEAPLQFADDDNNDLTNDHDLLMGTANDSQDQSTNDSQPNLRLPMQQMYTPTPNQHGFNPPHLTIKTEFPQKLDLDYVQIS